MPQETQKAIALDLEVVHTVEEPYSFDRPWELGVAVAVTYSPEESFRDWIGGLEKPTFNSPDIPKLICYLKQFDRVVTFNGLRFDYAVLDGYLDRLWRFGYKHDVPAWTHREFKGRSIDLCLDIMDANRGKRAGLDAVMRGTLGYDKAENSALIPEMWRSGKRSEVIAGCREHTQATYEIWKFGLEHGRIHYRYGSRSFTVGVGQWRVR